MDDIKLACNSSDEHGGMQIENDSVSLSTLYNQIQHVLSSSLSGTSIMVIKEDLHIMKRCSYYLEIKYWDLPPHAVQHIICSSDPLWSLIDKQRLQSAMTLAKTQVRLILNVLELIYQEIIHGCQDLEAFLVNDNQGFVDCDIIASVQQKLWHTQKYVSDFKTRMTRNLGPLRLNNQLIHNMGNFATPLLSVSLTIKKPVVFDRSKSCASSNSAYLSWEVAGEQSEQSKNDQFEIQTKRLHQATNDQDPLLKLICQSYSIQVNNLTSDRFYEFSVKRVDTFLMVYRTWIDTIILKTVGTSK